MSLDILREFKNNIVIFLDELIDQFPQETNLIIARLFIKDRIPIEDVINNFIQNVLPLKEIISIRDEKFFLETNVSIFQGLDKSSVNHFKTLWKSNTLDSDDKDVIWQWIDTFIILSEKYQRSKLRVN